MKRKRENLCRPLYQTQAQVLRQDEGRGRPGGAVFWGGQRNLSHNGIAAEIQEVVLILNILQYINILIENKQFRSKNSSQRQFWLFFSVPVCLEIC